MTAATNGAGPDLIEVLTRADRRWVDRRADEPAPPDYLRHLEQFLRPLVDEASNGDGQASISDADERNLRAQVMRARTDVERLHRANQDMTKELGRVRTDYADSVQESARLADQVEQLRRERDQLAEQLHAKSAHVCAWPWPDPNQPVQPCECGRPFPRYLEQAEDDDEPVAVEPWTELFDRIRAELGAG